MRAFGLLPVFVFASFWSMMSSHPTQEEAQNQKSRTKEYDLNVFHDGIILIGKRK